MRGGVGNVVGEKKPRAVGRLVIQARVFDLLGRGQQRQVLPSQTVSPPTISQAVGQTAVDSGLLDDLRGLAEDAIRGKRDRTSKRKNS